VGSESEKDKKEWKIRGEKGHRQLALLHFLHTHGRGLRKESWPHTSNRPRSSNKDPYGECQRGEKKNQRYDEKRDKSGNHPSVLAPFGVVWGGFGGCVWGGALPGSSNARLSLRWRLHAGGRNNRSATWPVCFACHNRACPLIGDPPSREQTRPPACVETEERARKERSRLGFSQW